MADLDRVKRNISRMISMNAPETDIDGYIASEGVTLDQVRAHKVGAVEPEKPQVSRVESLGRGAIQGASLGFSDELLGGLAAAGGTFFGDFNYGDNYRRVRDQNRAGNEAARAANPGTYLTGEIGGSVAVPFGAARAAASAPRMVQSAARATGIVPEIAGAATFGQRVGQGARMGAGYGGLYGLGNSEADLTQGEIGKAAMDAGKGAAIGTVLGGATVPAVDAVAAVGRGLLAPIRNRIDPKAAAGEQVLDKLTKDMKAGPRLETRARAMAEADADTMIADVGGTSTKRLLRSAQNQQSPRNEVLGLRLDQRQKFQANKIERELRQGLKIGGDDYYQSIDDVTARLKEIGNEGFKPALAQNTPVTPQLMQVLERPEMKDVLKAVVNDFGTEGAQPTTTQILHRAKVEIDEMIRAARKAAKIGMDRTAGFDVRKYQKLKTDLLANIKNDDYKKALATYADEASLRSAAQDGFEDFLQMPMQEVRKVMKSLGSEAERQMFKRGAVQAVMERVRTGNPMNDKVRGVLSSDGMMGRLRPLFDNQKEWREFQKLLVTVSRQSKTRAAAQGNSTTAQQLSDMVDAGQTTEAVKQTANMATGNWREVLSAAGRMGSRAAGMTPEVADEVLRILMQRPGMPGMGNIGTTNRTSAALNTPELMRATARRRRAQEKRDTFSRGVVAGSTGQIDPQ